ncbi:hypothetical protein C8R43DRAFT_569152 [Mycena crocata]|nr:hypothetical protein C8R43DRAFT_569152 [Mycena crocata]
MYASLEAESDSNDDIEEVKRKRGRFCYSERFLRVECHKLHTLALLTNAWVRNKWIIDPLLQARLLSLTPLSLQTAFGAIHKSRIPEQHQRGRMFETAMGKLTFCYEAVQKAMEPYPADEAWDIELLQEVLDDEGEFIKSPKSLMKHALMQKGSRDTSAQLFTALCRGLGIPARLVVSLQSVSWQGKNTGNTVPTRNAKGKEKVKPVRELRKTKSKGNVLSTDGTSASSPKSQIDPVTTPPVFWTEVFSRPDARWLPVDPVRGIVNQPHIFDPSSAYSEVTHMSSSIANANSVYARPSTGPITPSLNSGKPSKRGLEDNHMLYVLAFEEDGYARDVTRRYARQFAAKVAKVQGGPSKGAWWERTLEGIRRPYRLHRDDVEDAELETAQLLEGMPTTIAGFKDHPVYALVRHLTQMQTIHPPPPLTHELGQFRGEAVYPRSAVVSLKTAANWMRSEGRQIKEGEQPMKLVKMRASTIGRMREVELMREGLRVAGEHAETEAAAAASDGDDQLGESSAKEFGKEWENEVMQGLYALSQTEPYVSNPVVNGKIPKNNFGNIDLYVPSMLPAGAVHLPFEGTAKTARKLGFDYAEAVTGFEFKNRRATPIMQGVVIAAENEEAMLEAYWDAENDAAEKARVERRARVLKWWTRLVHGLRIRQSLKEEYKDREPATVEGGEGKDVQILPRLAGSGFVTGADDVVQTYHLPNYQHLDLPFQRSSDVNSAEQSGEGSDGEAVQERQTYDLEMMDVDSEPGNEDAHPRTVTPENVVRAPKTMQQLAGETSARLRKEFARGDIGEDVKEIRPPPPPTTASAPKANKTRQTKPSKAPSERNPTKTKAKAGVPAARRASAASAKRRRNDRTNSDSEEKEEEEGTEPSPAKRPKSQTDNGVAASSLAPAPARSLRPRRSKTQTQLQEEQEREHEFQRAIAK